MRPRFHTVLQVALDEGIRYGLHCAYKHTDNPSTDQIVDAVTMAITNSLEEWFFMEGSDGYPEPGMEGTGVVVAKAYKPGSLASEP